MRFQRLIVQNLVLITLALFLAPGSLFASEGYQKGRWFLDIRGGGLLSVEGYPKTLVDNTNSSYMPVGYYSLTYGSDADRIMNMMTYTMKDTAKINGFTGEIAFEYSLLDWLGIGGDIHHTSASVSNIPSYGIRSHLLTNIMEGFYLNYVFGVDVPTLILMEKIDPLSTTNVDLISATTLSFNLAFHFNDRSAWDPYLKIHLGFGAESEFGNTILFRPGLTLGSRFFMSDLFYISTELTGTYNYIQSSQTVENSNGSSTTITTDLSFTDSYAQIGFGVAI